MLTNAHTELYSSRSFRPGRGSGDRGQGTMRNGVADEKQTNHDSKVRASGPVGAGKGRPSNGR